MNRASLICFLYPLIGGADDDEMVEEYNYIFDESDYRLLIQSTLKESFFNIKSKKRQEKAKLSLSYCLSLDYYYFITEYDSCLSPVELRIDARNFYLWIWEEFFPGEDYHLESLEQYEIVFLPSELD